jgi:tRNA (pseudouridine54-N1)-methyltransferase
MSASTPIVFDPPGPLRRFVVIGSRAKSSADFKLHALGDSGGRMDILVRCMRAALLQSDGVRRDTILDLLLLGPGEPPLLLRLDGRAIRGLRPDEARNARTLQRALAARHPGAGPELVAPGILAAPMQLQDLMLDQPGTRFVLARGGADVHTVPWQGDVTFVLGDDKGISQEHREVLQRSGAVAVGLGPVELHTEDAITVVHNVLDRRIG